MTIRKFAIAAAAAAMAMAAGPALPADLDHSMKDGPYDDPRYSDIYRHPAPPPPPRYATPYYPPPPPVYREERYVPPPYPPLRSPQYLHEERLHTECLPRDTVRNRLASRGWHDFHDPQVMGNVVHVRARRPNGRLFDVTLDRCSGEVMSVQPMHERAAAVPPPPPPPHDWRYRERRYHGY